MFWFIFQFLFLLLCSWLGALYLPPVNSIQLLKLSEIGEWRENGRENGLYFVCKPFMLLF